MLMYQDYARRPEVNRVRVRSNIIGDSFSTVITWGNMTTGIERLPYQFIAKICLVFSDLGPLSFASTEEATSFKDR